MAVPARGQRQVKTREAPANAAYAGRMAPRGILVVEDDDAIATGLVRVLTGQGFTVRRLDRGAGTLAAIDAATGLLILDLGLPDIDGLEICRRVRAAHPALAILIVTARDQELDVVAGLDAGADDYLIKPFRLSELLARVRAHLRRHAAAPESAAPLKAGELTVDQAARRAWRDDEELTLRPKEFDLLALLVSEAGRVLTRERLMREVWNTEWMGSTKTLDTHMRTLRLKVGHDAIATLRGVGYRLEVP
jgi:DNA-binding response OmpR family regulator